MTALLRQSAVPPIQPSFWRICWAHRATVLAGVLLGLLLGSLIAYFTPRCYSSTATLIFPTSPFFGLPLQSKSNDLPSIPLLSGVILVPQTGSSALSASVLLHSSRARLAIIARLRKQGIDLEKAWRLDHAKVLRRLDTDLECKIGDDGELIAGFRDTDKERACLIMQAALDELGDLTAALGQQPSEWSLQFLRERVKDSEARLNRAQTALLAFQQQHQIIAVDEQAQQLTQQYITLADSLQKARLAAELARGNVAKVAGAATQLVKACIDPTVDPTAPLNALYKDVTARQAALALLKTKYTPAHPDVQEQTKELAQAQALLQREVRRQLALINMGASPVVLDQVLQASAAQTKAAGLQQATDKMKAELAKFPRAAGSYMLLAADAAADAAAVKLFRTELEKARVISLTRQPVFSVIDEPRAPPQPDVSRQVTIMVLAIFLGLCLACGKPYLAWSCAVEAYEAAQIGQWDDIVRARGGKEA